MKSNLLFLIVLPFCSLLHAQDNRPGKVTGIAYPIAFYTPETRLGAGAAGALNFHIRREDTLSPPSQIQLGFAYTQNRQWTVSLPFQLYFNKRKHTITGQLEYHHFHYFFFGTGHENRSGEKESYTVKFPLLRINYLRRLSDRWYAGIRWWFDDYNILEYEQGRLLDTAMIAGSRGSTSNGPGLVFLFDTRDNVYSTTVGSYLELVAHHQGKWLGSTYHFDRYRFDYRYFFPLRKGLIAAFHVFGDFLRGTTPFNNMASVGSSKRMRGFYEGRFRDNNLLLFQTEWRIPVYKNLGAAIFTSYAMLAASIESFGFIGDRCGAGAGIRYMLDKNKRVNIRLDAAWPVGMLKYSNSSFAKQTVFYLTIGEAF